MAVETMDDLRKLPGWSPEELAKSRAVLERQRETYKRMVEQAEHAAIASPVKPLPEEE